jgi:hypothetical protein
VRRGFSRTRYKQHRVSSDLLGASHRLVEKQQCPGRDSNPHSRIWPGDFKSPVSANSTTWALAMTPIMVRSVPSPLTMYLSVPILAPRLTTKIYPNHFASYAKFPTRAEHFTTDWFDTERIVRDHKNRRQSPETNGSVCFPSALRIAVSIICWPILAISGDRGPSIGRPPSIRVNMYSIPLRSPSGSSWTG